MHTLSFIPHTKKSAHTLPPHIRLQKKEARKKLRKESYSNSKPYYKHIALNIITSIISLLAKTMNYTTRLVHFYVEPATQVILEKNNPFLITLWHNRLFTTIFSVRRNFPKKGRDILAIISSSKDGEMITRLTEKWGGYVTRGSSSKKSMHATRELLRLAKLGFYPLITPDGPRGPRYVLKEGVVFLARISGLPIVPVCYAAEKNGYFTSPGINL